MRNRFVKMFGLVTLCAATAAGCGREDACEELEPLYRGAQRGTLIIMTTDPLGNRSGTVEAEVQGPFDRRDPYSGSVACSSPRQEDEPGWQVVAWLDVDGDEQQACSAPFPAQPGPDCAPDPQDPVVRRDYVSPASGTLLLQLELQDP